MANNKNSRKRRKKKKSRKLLLFVFEILLLAVLLLVAYFVSMMNRIKYENLDESEAGINSDLDENTILSLEGYTNIALFGLDNRSSNNYDRGNSDVIMIASINNKTKDIKLVSVYRDTYLSVGNGSYNKSNAAYAHGGAQQAVQMLNSNLDLDIKEYVCVDWAAMVEVIDDLGGLDLEITEGEMNQINKYKKDVDLVTGKSTPNVTQYGLVHLDGTQATTYARIRKLAGDDFKRAFQLVKQFCTEGSYRLFPDRISLPTTISNGKQIEIAHRWNNFGWGYCPTNIPQWKNKYKVAFALLDTKNDKPKYVFVDGEPEACDWVKGTAKSYTFTTRVEGVGAGKYMWAVGIVDTAKQNEIGIHLAVKNNVTSAGWLKLFEVTAR